MSYRGNSKRSSYGYQQRHSSSFGHYGNKNQRDKPSNNLLSNNQKPNESAIAITEQQNELDNAEFIPNNASFNVLIKASQNWTNNAWAGKLNESDNPEGQAQKIISIAIKQPIDLILFDPVTKQPLQKFRVKKIADLENKDSEIVADQNKPILNKQMSSLKAALEGFGFTLVEVEK